MVEWFNCERVSAVCEKDYVVINGIACERTLEVFPDGKKRPVYRFYGAGWKECRVTGLRAAKQVIRGRLDPAVRRMLGIDEQLDKQEQER